MKTSDLGKEFIKKFEALVLLSYKDIAGIWTIGYGHTRGVKEGQRITEEEANEFLEEDLIPGEEAINSMKIDFHQREFDALSSFIFNIGPSKFKKSTMYRYLYSKEFFLASQEFPKWNKARINGELKPVVGLTKRRNKEKELFLKGIYG